jgi:hypothetical protein
MPSSLRKSPKTHALFNGGPPACVASIATENDHSSREGLLEPISQENLLRVMAVATTSKKDKSCRIMHAEKVRLQA